MRTALRYTEVQALRYSRIWKASVFSNFLSPILYLAAMGIGLGSLVDDGVGSRDFLGGSGYLVFLAPGLLVGTAMQTAASEASFPVFAGLKWDRSYYAALATPLASRDLVIGHLIWVTVRVAMVCIAFTITTVLFGAMTVAGGLIAVAPAVLTGMAHAAPITAFAANLRSDTGLTTMFRFVIVPMFLFSGTFFPISQLPDWLEPAAYLVPLWHGVALTRSITLDVPFVIAPYWHILYLALWLTVGTVLSVRVFAKRLEI